MEIEQFIEEDIKKFLDEELKQKNSESETPSTTSDVLTPEEVGLYAPSRNYEKELDDSIKDANKSKAEQIINDLKGSIVSFPEGSPEQVERKRLVERLYHRFQQGFNPEQEARVAALANEIELMNSAKPVAPAKPNAPASDKIAPTPTKETLPHPPKETPPQAPSQAPEAKIEKRAPGTPHPHELSIEDEQAILADIQQIETLISEHSYAAAMKQYQQIKNGLSIEELMGDQRERILSRLMQVHESIASRLNKKVSGGAETEQRLNEHLNAASQAIETKNKAEAMRQYQSAKEIFMTLPDEHRTALQDRLLTVFNRIKGEKEGEAGTLLDEEEKQLHGSP